MKTIALFLFIFLFASLISSVFAQNKPDLNSIKPICNGLATYLPKPEVPQSVINANGKNIFGIVNVQILIDEQGNVEKAQAVSGHPLVKPLAEKAARQAKFGVTTDIGKPIKINCVLVYNFASYDPNKSKEKAKKENDSTIYLGRLNDKALFLPMPKYLAVDASGNITIQVKIDLQSGKVVLAKAISGHPLLRIEAEKAALQSKFPAVLSEFPNAYGTGFIIFKFEEFNGKTIEKKNPKPFLIIEKGVVNKRALDLPKPYYSPDIKATGMVEVRVVIDVEGKIVLAKTVSGHPLLQAFAETAARKAAFRPTLITTSEAIYVKATLLYKFNSDHTVETNLSDKDLN